MSNKPLEKLLPMDQTVRRVFPTAMVDGTRLTIEFISGFEKFNTRPYHNYETWGQGWRITDHELLDTRTGRPTVVEREDLDDALAAWVQKREDGAA